MVTSAPRHSQRRGWYYGWNIVAVVAVAQIAGLGLSINCMSLFLQSWSADLHSPISKLLAAFIPLVVVSGLVSPVVGTLADKYPARWLFGISLSGMALFYFALSAITATWQMWALYTFLPVLCDLCGTIPSNAVVSRWFVRRAGLALGITAFGPGSSGLLLSVPIADAIPLIGWRAVLRIVGLIVALVILPLTVWVLRDGPGEREGMHYLSDEGDTAARHPSEGSNASLRWTDILQRRNFWLLLLYVVPMASLFVGVLQNLAPIASSHSLDQKSAGVLLFTFSVAHVCSTLLMGFLADRYGNRLPQVGLALFTATGAVLLGYGDGLTVMILGSALCGLSGGVWTLLPAAARVEFGSGSVGRAIGALFLFIPLTSVVPALAARANESMGSYGPAMLALSAVSLAAGTLALLTRDKHSGLAKLPVAVESASNH